MAAHYITYMKAARCKQQCSFGDPRSADLTQKGTSEDNKLADYLYMLSLASLAILQVNPDPRSHAHLSAHAKPAV